MLKTATTASHPTIFFRTLIALPKASSWRCASADPPPGTLWPWPPPCAHPARPRRPYCLARAIGDLRISAHEPAGDWLYGVELAVHPDYQGHGIGTALYQARFDLVRSLNLRGWYAVGMLMGVQRLR